MSLLKNPFSQVVQPDEVFEVQKAQYQDRILLTGTVVAGSSGTDFVVNVASHGHFLCQFITGTFECLYNNGAVVDLAVTFLSGQLKDGPRNLFTDRVPFDTFLTPGRQKSINSTTVATDPVGNQLSYPILPCEHLFLVNTNITMNIANSSNVNNRFWIVFHGWRILTGAAADKCRAEAKRRAR